MGEKKRGEGGRSGVKEVGERGGGRYRSSVQPGSGEGRQRTDEELWVSVCGA